jgi:hypothetical protein
MENRWMIKNLAMKKKILITPRWSCWGWCGFGGVEESPHGI